MPHRFMQRTIGNFPAMRLWTRLALDRPGWILLGVVVLTLISGVGLARVRLDTSPNAVFSSDNQSNKQLQRLHQVFGPDDNDLLLMIEGDGLLQRASITRLRRFRDSLQSLPSVATVTSVFDLRKGRFMLPVLAKHLPQDWDAATIRSQLTSHRAARDNLISADGKLLVFWVTLRGSDLSHSQLESALGPIDREIDSFENDSGLRVWQAGHPAIRIGVLSSIEHSLYAGTALALVSGTLASMALFRSLTPVGVCLLGPSLGAAWTFGLMGWCGVSVGGLTSSLPSLIFVIGLTDAVHLLLAMNRHLRRGASRRRSIIGMLRRVGPACVLTSVTTTVGFGSLLLSRLDAVSEFGLWAAIGSIAALTADLCVLPLAATYLSTARLTGNRGARLSMMESITAALTRLPLRFPRIVSVIGIVLLTALVPIAIRQRVDITWTEAIPENDPTNQALHLADQRLGGALPVMVVIQWPDSLSFPASQIHIVAGQVHQAIDQTQGFAPASSIYHVMADLPGNSWAEKYKRIKEYRDSLRRMFQPAQNQLLVSTRVPNDGAIALQAKLARLQTRLDAIAKSHPEFQIHVTGTVVAASENMRAVIGDLAKSLALASGLIFAVMTLQFRSLRLGLICILPNAMPLLITAAGLVALGFPLQITSALTFTLCLGLAVDDTIHVVTHFQHQRRRIDNAAAAVSRTMLIVGPALLLTTGILVSGFGAMLLNPMPAIKMFSALSCVTMIAALVGDLMILPALLIVGFSYRSKNTNPAVAAICDASDPGQRLSGR